MGKNLEILQKSLYLMKMKFILIVKVRFKLVKIIKKILKINLLKAYKGLQHVKNWRKIPFIEKGKFN